MIREKRRRTFSEERASERRTVSEGPRVSERGKVHWEVFEKKGSRSERGFEEGRGLDGGLGLREDTSWEGG